MLSDGDCQEGETWEGAAAASHYKLPNITAILDYNHLQTDGTTEEVMDVGDARAKFESFGWDAVEIDGHDMGQITEALERSRTLDRPAAIICPDEEGPRRLLHGGPLRLSRQAPHRGAGTEGLEELEARLKEQTKRLKGEG